MTVSTFPLTKFWVVLTSTGRWVNRPSYPASRYAERHDPTTIPGKIYAGVTKLIQLRKTTEELAGGRAVGFFTGNNTVLGYQRPGSEGTVLCLCNFSDYPQWVGRDRFMGCPVTAKDLWSGYDIALREAGIELRPHQFLWLKY